MALAIARAFRWQEMIETGRAQSNSDLARKLKLDQSYIARTIRLTSLAPNLIKAILLGQEPESLNVSAASNTAHLQVDLNYMFRVPLRPVQITNAHPVSPSKLR